LTDWESGWQSGRELDFYPSNLCSTPAREPTTKTTIKATQCAFNNDYRSRKGYLKIIKKKVIVNKDLRFRVWSPCHARNVLLRMQKNQQSTLFWFSLAPNPVPAPKFNELTLRLLNWLSTRTNNSCTILVSDERVAQAYCLSNTLLFAAIVY